MCTPSASCGYASDDEENDQLSGALPLSTAFIYGQSRCDAAICVNSARFVGWLTVVNARACVCLITSTDCGCTNQAELAGTWWVSVSNFDSSGTMCHYNVSFDYTPPCSGHGSIVHGACECNPAWGGASGLCDVPVLELTKTTPLFNVTVPASSSTNSDAGKVKYTRLL